MSGHSAPGTPAASEAIDTDLPTDAEGWTRVHPASPVIRSWAFILITVFAVGRGIAESVINDVMGLSDDAPEPPPESGGLSGTYWPFVIFGTVVVLVAAAFVLSWWFTRFRLEEERIALREGWLFRKQRQMRYDRIQAVDLQFPLLARIFGLAKVRIEAADGGESALELIYLARARAEEARREILDQVAGRVAAEPAVAAGAHPAVADALDPERHDPTDATDPTVPTVAGVAGEGSAARAGVEDPPSPAQPHAGLGSTLRRNLLLQDEGTRMLSVPVGRLLGSVLLSGAVLGTVLAIGAVVGLGWAGVALLGDRWQVARDIGDVGWGILAASIVPLGIGVITASWGAINKGWNFTVFHTQDGLRLTYGLTESSSQTIPPGRVQGVTVKQPLLWRPFGWHAVKVVVAGYGSEDPGKARNVALPVGPWEDVLRVLTVVAPDPGLDGDPRAAAGLTPARLMELAATGSGEEGGFTHIPRRAAWYFHWHTWRRNGFTTTPTLLVLRRGRLGRSFSVVAHERIEAVQIDQGPVQRRLKVATVFVNLPGKAIPFYADDVDETAARALFEGEAAIAAVARRLKDRNQWMRPEELERFDRQLERMGHAATEDGAAQTPRREG